MRKKSNDKKMNIKPKSKLAYKPKNKKNKMMQQQRFKGSKRKPNNNNSLFTTKINK